jgi:hypothetical protein
MTEPATPDPVPTPDPAPAADSTPAADAVPESAPAADPAAAPDSVSADSTPAAESVSDADADPDAAAEPAPAADSVPGADPAGAAEPAPAAESTSAVGPSPGEDSGPAFEPPASPPDPAASQRPADLPPSARDDSAQGNPWAVASAESAAAANPVPGPHDRAGSAEPAPSAAQPAASGTGWPDPAPAQRDSGAAAAADRLAARGEPLTGKVSPVNGRRPADRRGPGSADSWSAATDPIGGGSAAGGRPSTGPQSTGEPSSGSPAPRWDAGPAGDRDKIRSVPARRPAPRRPETRRPAPPSSDLLGDLQRWLVRSGTKSMRRQVEGQVRRTLGGGRRPESGDTWGTATTEPPPHLGDSPECAWCPICRAARRMRESGPDLGSQLSGASDVVASAVQDAIVAVDAIFSRTASASGSRRPADGSPDTGHADSAGDAAERGSDEPGDRG